MRERIPTMADDLYTELLGIPPGPRPPDHYALLGIPLFCGDSGSIEAAVEKRLETLDQYALHPDRAKRDAVQRMMNEVSQARMCLAAPARKQSYDRELAAKMAVHLPATSQPQPVPLPGEVPVLEQEEPPQAPKALAARWAYVLGGLAAALAVALVLVLVLRPRVGPASSRGPEDRAAGASPQKIEALVWAATRALGELKQMDRGQGFAGRLDEAERLFQDAEDAMRRQEFAETREALVEFLDRARSLETLQSQRALAIKAREPTAAARKAVEQPPPVGESPALATARQSWKAANDAFERGDFAEAGRQWKLSLARYEEAAGAAAVAATAAEGAARAARQGADEAKNAAAKAGAEAQAKAAWDGAEDLYRKAVEAFGAKDFTRAKGLWGTARAEYLRAQSAAANAGIVGPARAAMEAEAGRYDIKVLQEYGGPIWQEVLAARKSAYRPEAEAKVAASDFDRARRLLPDAYCQALLNKAKANDTKEKAATALAALEELLKVKPNDDEALKMKVRILQDHLGIQVRPFTSTEAAKRQEEAARNLGVDRDIALDLGNGVSMKLVLIPAGIFVMGCDQEEEGHRDDEGPPHEVTISRPFYMSRYEVTQQQYESVTGKNPSSFRLSTGPVEQVSWEDSVDFCRKMSQKTGRKVRLPTEAEWEYACRAGTKTPFHTGATISTLQANYDGSIAYGSGKKGAYLQKTCAVGSFPPNSWGLYDMHGNVSEWCSDWKSGAYQAAKEMDPRGPEKGQMRVVRGGGWFDPPRICRSAHRHGSGPDMRNADIGFRVVVTVEPSTTAKSQPATGAATAPHGGADNEQAFAELLAQVKLVLVTTPLDREKLTEEHKARLREALRLIDVALEIKPQDQEALSLRAKIQDRLAPKKTLTLDPGKGVTMELAIIPSGRFMMGSPRDEQKLAEQEVERTGAKGASYAREGPQREVTISNPFYMGIHEVTQEQYETITGKNPSYTKGASNPVEGVSWDDAVDFCDKVSRRTGKKVRLPTEAEWEYACRAGSTTRFCFGDDERELGKHAWYAGNSGSKTHPVGQKAANAFGLYDMHGNVYEWCSDWYADSYENAKKEDPQGPASGGSRLCRGGCWSNVAHGCRSAFRFALEPGSRRPILGFRVVMEPASATTAPSQPATFSQPVTTSPEAKRDAESARLLAQAKLKLLPVLADKNALTTEQMISLRDGLRFLQDALALNRQDKEALDLIEKVKARLLQDRTLRGPERRERKVPGDTESRLVEPK